MRTEELEGIIEGLLFVSGDELPLGKISEILEIDQKVVKGIIDNMIQKINNSDRGIMIRKINNAYQLCTNSKYYEYFTKLQEPRQKQQLSQAAFETLSIIAYNSPITRAKIEAIRGVNSDSAIATLIERNLIREAGRMDAPGKPILYEVTEEFLRCFGYSSLKDLPALDTDGDSQEI
ncbi:MAG TPA: SMC-Scp complex subunit ScpB [Clostridiaceae bacterium]|nr:SMC-Scp complex subunit ScpB [Clostridiaceae bacterium]